MRRVERARFAALALLAAVAGSASVGIAALASEGLCLHRLGLFGLHAEPASGAALPLLAMPADAGAPCPVLITAAAGAAILYVLALAAIVFARPSASDLAFTSARIVLGVRFAPLALVLTIVGAVPLGAAMLLDGSPPAITAFIAAAFSCVAAVLIVAVLRFCANAVLAFAIRLAASIIALFRLLVPGADAPWLALHDPLPVAAGVVLGERMRSRAPPVAR